MGASRPDRPADGPRRTPPSRPPPPRTGPPPPPSSRFAQRALAVLLTGLLFGLIVFGAAAGADAVGAHRWEGYLVGGVFCLVMVLAAVRSSRH